MFITTAIRKAIASLASKFTGSNLTHRVVGTVLVSSDAMGDVFEIRSLVECPPLGIND